MTANTAKTGFGARLAGIFNRAAGHLSLRLHVAAANLWRDNYNPLRGLTIARAVNMLEDGERGAYGEVQWTYRYIEMQDATIGALVERRTAAIQRLDWNIKISERVPADKKAVAERQAAALRAAYDKIDNLTGALEFLEMAAFRGFAHLEMVEDGAGNVVRLAPVEQWFWVRDGLYGAWKINPHSTFGTTQGEAVDLRRFVVRECARPINRVALIAFIRKALSQKDWDAYIETYGVPAVFIVMPDNLPQNREAEFLTTAEAVASDARGVLPGGSKVETVNPGATGTDPFRAHLDYQDQQIVMRGTGGLLTMLAQSGSGTLAGGAHSETFEAIARAEAAEISEVLQGTIDRRVLAAATPGEPAWAYFELAANEETDTKAITEDVARLAAAGYRVKPAWVAERTGYELQGSAGVSPASKTEDSKTEDRRLEGLTNRGGWRTLDDGRRVFIAELENPTEDDDDTGYTKEPKHKRDGGGGGSEPKQERSKKEDDNGEDPADGSSGTFTKFKQDADDRAEGEYLTGKRKERFRIHPSGRGVKDKVVFKSEYVESGSSSGFFSKARGDSVAEALGARYSRAQNGYVMSKAQFAKWKELIEKGYDGNDFTGEIYHPDGDKAPSLSFKLRGGVKNREGGDDDEDSPAWIDALATDLQPLGKALASAMNAGDEAAMKAALRKISAEMPEFLDSPALEDALAEDFAAALAGEDVRNGRWITTGHGPVFTGLEDPKTIGKLEPLKPR